MNSDLQLAELCCLLNTDGNNITGNINFTFDLLTFPPFSWKKGASAGAAAIKDQMLAWCQQRTKGYQVCSLFLTVNGCHDKIKMPAV